MTRIFQRILPCLVFAFLGAGLAFTVAGCGKKGPPLPPTRESEIPAAPTGLKYTLKDRDLTLSWTCGSLENKEQGPQIEGFEVFMATKPLGGCQGCPFIFKSLGVVPMPRTSFVYTLDQDLNYYFRVQTLGRDNIKSKESDTLNIEFP